MTIKSLHNHLEVLYKLQKTIIALDIDGVIVDFARPFIEHSNERLGRRDRYEDCRAHNFSVAFSISEELTFQLLAEFEERFDMEYPHLIEGVVDALDVLKERYRFVAITSRGAQLEEPTRRFFQTHFPFVTPFFANGRNNPFATTEGRLTKTRMAEQVAAAILIEDNEEEFLHWDSRTVKPICFRHPWNASLAKTHPHVPRLVWSEIVDHLMSAP